MIETETVTEVTDTPAVATDPAAAANAATQATETQTEGEAKETAAERTFTQSELDEIVQKRVAKVEAKSARQLLRAVENLQPRQVQRQEVQTDTEPSREQFASDAAYINGLVDWRLDQRERGSRQKQASEANEKLTVKTEKMHAELYILT